MAKGLFRGTRGGASLLMVYEFALSPSLCSNWHDLRFFLQTFGKEEGRLFSDIPRRNWIRLPTTVTAGKTSMGSLTFLIRLACERTAQWPSLTQRRKNDQTRMPTSRWRPKGTLSFGIGIFKITLNATPKIATSASGLTNDHKNPRTEDW